MLRLTLLLWSIVATVLAGVFIMIVLVVPSLAQQDAQLILPAVISGVLVAIPISYLIAKKLMTLGKNDEVA